MEAYTDFASVYDQFMDETPYEQWCQNILAVLREYDIQSGLILELGCGTGSMTELLAENGYDMIGIDYSQDMLNIAMDKREESGHQDILYLNQDMREFELYGTVAAVVSFCDSMNYLTSEDDLLQVFKLVNNYLDPGGYFIFDMKTEYHYETLMGNRTIVDNREDCSLIWENFYDKEKQLNQYDITIYAKAEFEEEDEDD